MLDMFKRQDMQVTLQPPDSERNHLNNIKFENNTTIDLILFIHIPVLSYKLSYTDQNIMIQSWIR